MGKKFVLEQLTICCFAILLLPRCFTALDYPVETKSGKISGTFFYYNGTAVPAYLGIPFAQPPVGDLRFRKTEPVKPWTNIFQARRFSSACYQVYPPNLPWVDIMPNHSEDCLYLNIWVPPNTNKDAKKAVMFWIYSGALSFGSNRLPVYDGGVLAAERDVVVVNTNYRIGILGFLSSVTEKTEAPGNMGLYDILTALKWVKDNIESFGGDSNKITVFGQGVGGVISGLLCISPLSKDMFQRAIMQSGSPATPVICSNKENAELALKVANDVGCTGPLGVVKCLRSKDAWLLVEKSLALSGPFLTFATICGDDFLPVDPQVQLRTGLFHDVEIMIGNTQDEGSFNLVVTFNKTFGTFGKKSSRFSKASGKKYIRAIFAEHPAKEEIVNYYLRDVNEYDYVAIREQTYHSIGDPGIICPDMYFAESYAKEGKNVYAYYFNHIPSITPWEPWLGSTHFDEVAFVFGRPVDHPSDYTADEQQLSRKMMKIWSNFAKNGNPGFKNWPKYSREKPYFKVFNLDNRKSYLEKHKNNCDFWRQFTGFA